MDTTPQTIQKPQKPKVTLEVKLQLLENLEFEVTHRTQQLELWLAHALQNFLVQQENQVTHISKQVRTLTMREFMHKYNGNVHTALKGIQRDKINADMKAAGIEDGAMSPKKRKWLATREEGDGASGSNDTESSKAAKSARMMRNTPKRKAAVGVGQHSRLNATSKTRPSRIPQSPSPNKSRLPFSVMPSRPTSPTKIASPSKLHPDFPLPPSTTTFNPALLKTRVIHKDGSDISRLPRRDEGLFSMNGSPLTNPYKLGLGWFKIGDTDDSGFSDSEHGDGNGRKLKRTKSTISIRRDPSFAQGSATSSGLQSRTNSQASLFNSNSTSTSTSSFPSTMFSAHSRNNSQSESEKSLGPPIDCTPKPPSRHGSAYVTIPTRGGHVLEFDALLTSPGAIDALEGISQSAKKQARQEIGSLVQAAVDKWKIA